MGAFAVPELCGRGQQFPCGTSQLSDDGRIWIFVCGEQKADWYFRKGLFLLCGRRNLCAAVSAPDAWSFGRIGGLRCLEYLWKVL